MELNHVRHLLQAVQAYRQRFCTSLLWQNSITQLELFPISGWCLMERCQSFDHLDSLQQPGTAVQVLSRLHILKSNTKRTLEPASKNFGIVR